MNCSCDVSPVAFSVPEPLSECAPQGAETAAICPRCLAVEPTERQPDAVNFHRVSEAFPDGDGGAAMALTLGLLDSLAHNRTAIETTLSFAERAGTDPLLVVDRLVADPSVVPAIDLDRRRDKLESLLY